MSEPEAEMNATRQPGELNETQQRRLLVTCQYIDKLLSDIEHALHSASSRSPFPRYVMDITPTQAASLEDHIRVLRAQLLRTLAWQHIAKPAGDSGDAIGDDKPSICQHRD